MPSRQDVVKAFEEGQRCQGSSALWTDGTKLYSYETVILQRLDDHSIVANITKYSHTTSVHQSIARVRQHVAHKQLDSVPRGTADLAPLLRL